MKKGLLLMGLLIIALNIMACGREKENKNMQTSSTTEVTTSSSNQKISYEEAKDKVGSQLSKGEKKEILKENNPHIIEITVKNERGILKHVKRSIVGKKVFKLTYTTKNDNVLGPIVYLVDEYTGEIVGEYYRE